MGIFLHQDVGCTERVEEDSPVALDAEQHEVRPDPLWVQRPLAGLGNPAGAHDARQGGERDRQALRVAVILGQPVDHPVRPVREGNEPGSRDDARLAHPAAEQLPRPSRPADERTVADDQGPDGAGEALRETKGHGVRRSSEFARRDT